MTSGNIDLKKCGLKQLGILILLHRKKYKNGDPGLELKNFSVIKNQTLSFKSFLFYAYLCSLKMSTKVSVKILIFQGIRK